MKQPPSNSLLAKSASRRALLRGAVAGGGALLAARFLPGSIAEAAIGPSTKVEPYLVSSIPTGVDITSIFTTGDSSISGYRMVGIPDGLGAFAVDSETFSLYMNHELPNTEGVARAHGSKGAFVSRWTIERKGLRVRDISDLTPSPSQVHLWDAAGAKYTEGTTAWSRLCSADLAPTSGLSFGAFGTEDRIFMDGEEVSDGRGWARVTTGAYAGHAWQLPRLGRMPFENILVAPLAQKITIAISLEDGNLNTAPVAANNPCELYVYIGEKDSSGPPPQLAGLTNGKLYGVRIWREDGMVLEESNTNGLGGSAGPYAGSGRFELIPLGEDGNVAKMSTTLALSENAIANKVSRLQRIEDGAWDPRPGKQNDFYFVTTASFTTNSRLWRLRFNDITNPMLGGTIEILLRGSEGQHMFDNIAIDRLGRMILLEDPGNEAYIAKIWLYGIDNRKFTEIARHNPKFFEPGSAQFITQDEESSGVIDAADVLGEGWFLLDVQSHKLSSDPELVEGGQLLAMRVDPSIR